MGSHHGFGRTVRWLGVASLGAITVLAGCGQTRSNGGSPAATSGRGPATSEGGAAGKTAAPASGGTTAAGGPSDVAVGDCVFDDPYVAELVRASILQADGLDGPVDGSVGTEAIKELRVGQAFGALGGIECLVNLEELTLSVYEPQAPRVELASLAGLARLRRLELEGPFVLDGMLGGLSLEHLTLRRLPVSSLAEVAKETRLRDLALTGVPLESLAGVEALTSLTTLFIEDAGVSSLAPLGKLSQLTKLELRDLPALKSLAGLEPHEKLLGVLSVNVPLESLKPLAKATGMVGLLVSKSSLASLEGLQNKPLLASLTVTDGQLKDLAPLAGLPLLSDLSVAGNRIVDLSPLATCLALSSLDASQNRIESLAPLAPLTSLHTLGMANNLLEAIDADLPSSLRTLWVPRNAITSLEPLASHALETLDVSSNPLVSLDALFDLPALRYLTANAIGATELTAFPLSTLGHLEVQDNRITSAVPLSGLKELSVDLSGNDIVTLPADFVGLATQCGGLRLLRNPLDAAARERLAWLCTEGRASYWWDGGACDKCPRV